MTTPAQAAAEALAERGFAVLEGFLGPEELAVLRAECDALTGDAAAEGRAAELVDRHGCILEPVDGRLVSPSERQAAPSMEAYRALRERCAAHAQPSLAARVMDEVVRKPALEALLEAIFGEFWFLYNEQYIVKPPHAPHSAFAWHRDCDHAGTGTAFVSCWFALGPVHAASGGLAVLPYGASHEAHAELVQVPAGSLVLLAHDVQHKSGPNTTAESRAAYMVQFSQLPMERDGRLVAFAARCEPRLEGQGTDIK